MLKFVVLVALVGCGEIMVATELLFAMLAFERQEIDEAAVLSGALVSDGEESSRRFGCCSHGWWYQNNSEPENTRESAYICLDQRGHASLSASPRQARSESAVTEVEEGGYDYVSQPEPSSAFEKREVPQSISDRLSSGNASTTDPHSSLMVSGLDSPGGRYWSDAHARLNEKV